VYLSGPYVAGITSQILSSASQAENSSSSLSELDQEEQQEAGQNKTEEAQKCKIKVHLLYGSSERVKEREESERGVGSGRMEEVEIEKENNSKITIAELNSNVEGNEEEQGLREWKYKAGLKWEVIPEEGIIITEDIEFMCGIAKEVKQGLQSIPMV
jgi:hypothetical protein